MSNRKKKSTAASAGSGSSNKWAQIGLKCGEYLAGIAVGSFIANKISSKDSVSGVDLLGLDGDTSGYVSPVVVALAGAAAIQFGKDELIKNIGTGCLIAGGVKLVNKFAGKSVISLSGTDENEKVFLPGICDAEELSVDAPNYVPTENAWQTSYNEPALISTPEVSGVGEVMTAEPVGGVLL